MFSMKNETVWSSRLIRY